MRYRLVKFADGRYGARRGWFSYDYLDLYKHGSSWTLKEHVDRWCKGTEDQAKIAIECFYACTDKGTLV